MYSTCGKRPARRDWQRGVKWHKESCANSHKLDPVIKLLHIFSIPAPFLLSNGASNNVIKLSRGSNQPGTKQLSTLLFCEDLSARDCGLITEASAAFAASITGMTDGGHLQTARYFRGCADSFKSTLREVMNSEILWKVHF